MSYLCSSCDLDACQNCDNCNGKCQDSKQKISNENGTFSFRSKSLEKDQPFLTAAEWNKLIDYIKDGYELSNAINTTGDTAYNGKNLRAGKKYENEFMSANMWNGAYARMKYLSTGSNNLGSAEKTGGPNGDIILASYFTDLEDYANYNFKTTYCDGSCESSCNICNSEKTTYCCSCNVCLSPQ